MFQLLSYDSWSDSTTQRACSKLTTYVCGSTRHPGYYKIGRTGCLSRRMKQLRKQPYSPYGLQLLVAFSGGWYLLEEMLHLEFADSMYTRRAEGGPPVAGEIFSSSPALETFLRWAEKSPDRQNGFCFHMFAALRLVPTPRPDLAPRLRSLPQQELLHGRSSPSS